MAPESITLSTADWPSKREAAAALGVTTKTLEKYVHQGKLTQTMQNQINKPARVVIDPESISRMLSERGSPVAKPLKTPERDGSQNFAELLAAIRPAHWPVYLSIDQAVEYSGLPRMRIRQAAREEKVRRIGVKYRRADFDAL
jgi:hypothetical protein